MTRYVATARIEFSATDLQCDKTPHRSAEIFVESCRKAISTAYTGAGQLVTNCTVTAELLVLPDQNESKP